MTRDMVEHKTDSDATQAPSPVLDRIHGSMVSLLARAGLEYRGGYVRTGEDTVHYLDYGPTEVSNSIFYPCPLVLLHGAGAGAAIWYRQIERLAVNRRVLLPDNPILGLSSDPIITCSLHTFALDHLLSFLDRMCLDVVDIAGLSLGGTAALGLAIEHPERVRNVAILNSVGLGRDLPIAVRLMGIPYFGRFFASPSKTLMDRAFVNWEVEHPERPDAEALKEYAYAVTRKDGHARHIAARRFTSLFGQIKVFSDSELDRIKAPTLIVWGANDRFFPYQHAERAHELIPNSRLEILPETGHLSIWDEPEKTAGLLAEHFHQP